MRKFIYIVFMALVGFSCNRDPFEQTNSQGEAKVSLNFEIPASDLVTTYSAADDAARENAIARMDVFAFDQSGAIVAGDEGHVVLTNVTLIEGKGRAMITVTLPAGSGSVERQFGILANAPDPVALDAITTLDGFRALEFTHGSTMRTASFLMSDISALNTITTTTPTINMSLRRAVARVDVLLEDKVTNFVITSARLVNVRDKGFVFGKNTTPDDLSSPLAVPTSSGLVSYTAVNARTDEQKRNFSALLYCPENYNADKTAAAATTAVIIGG
ncbi:MAG: FimB/Mfa2 family fimbrial subunit, partial [Rikenellaceae bacterium]